MDVNAQSESGKTVLMDAVNQGHLEVSQVLVRAKADVNITTFQVGEGGSVCLTVVVVVVVVVVVMVVVVVVVMMMMVVVVVVVVMCGVG